MAFYLKLTERYNTQGCQALETPAPGSFSPAAAACCAALYPHNSKLCPFCHALPMFFPLAMLQKPRNTPNTGRDAPITRCFVLGI